MNKTLKKILSGIITASMLMSSAVAVYAEEETTTTNPWAVEKASEDTFRFGLLTDVHIAPSDSTGVAKYMGMGLEAYEAMEVDGLTLPGDIVASQLAHTSTTIESDLYVGLYNVLDEYGYEIKVDDEAQNDANKKPLVYGMGNHEMASNHQNATGIWAAKDLFVTANGIDGLSTVRTVDGKYTGDYVTEMGGYTFIVSSANCGLFDAAYTPSAANGVGVDVESWVKEQIVAATTAYNGANKPIFYVQHIPVNTHGDIQSSKTNSDEFMEWLKDYPNVIVLSGHTHELLDDPRCISQDEGYTSIVAGVMATGNAGVWGASVDSTLVSGGPSGIKQSMAIDATYNETANSTDIKVYRLDVQKQEFIGEPFEFTINGEAQTKYSIANRFADEGKSTAAWNDGTSVTAQAVDGTRDVKVTFTTGATVTAGTNADVLQDDFVWAYKAFAVNNATGKADKVSTRAAEFYKDAETATRSFTLSELERNQDYTIKMYPLTVFQQKMTYAELDAAGVVANTATVKTNNVKTAGEIAQQMKKNILVSASKTATYLQHDGTISTLTDGDKYTFSDELWVNNTPGVGFVIDLERNYKISNINLVAYENNTPSGRNEFVIYGSKDNENWTSIYERKSSDVSDEFGTQAVHTLNCDVDDNYYRYIKIEYLAYALLADIEIYADVPMTNVAYNKSVKSTSTYDYAPTKNAVDGNISTWFGTKYSSATATTPYYNYLQIDLGKKYKIDYVETVGRPNYAGDSERSSWRAYGSNEVSNEADLLNTKALDSTIYKAITSASTGAHLGLIFEEKTSSSAPYQYITIRKTVHGALHLGEVRLYAVNPEVAEFTYSDGTVKLTFSEAMNFSNINNEIKVYDSTGTEKTVTFTPNADNTSVTFAASTGYKVIVNSGISNVYGLDMHEDAEFDIYDLSIDYSGKTKRKFENMNVAYGKDVITDYVSSTTPPAGVPDYYQAVQLTNGVQYGFVSATKKDFIVDLGRAYNLNKIVLKLPTTNSNDGAKIHYTLSGSADGETWTRIHKAPTDMAKVDSAIWNGRVGTFNIDEDVNYRYIKYSHPYYFVLEEIEAYADVEATQVTNYTNKVTSSSKEYQIANANLVDNNHNFTYVNGDGYNWISVEMDQAYPVGMYELFVRSWNEDGSHQMDNWPGAHKVKLYGSNTAPVEQLDEDTTNLSVTNLTPYGFDELADTFEAYPWSSLFPSGFGKSSLMPEGWIFTDGYKETLNNTTRYKNLTLKKYDTYNIEFGEFRAYVMNATVNAVDADANGVDIHFGDKMIADLLNDDTVTLTKDGVAVDFKGTLSENGMVYTLDADLADGFYTLTVADDVKNVLGVPMQADFTCELVVGDIYGIKTADGAAVEAIAANTTYVVTEPVSGNNARMAIVGIYNSDNMLVASATQNIPADYAKKYAEVEITTPETLAEGTYYVKYFIWAADTFAPALDEEITVF